MGLDAPETNKFYDNHIHQQQDPHYTWQRVFALQHPPAVPPGAPILLVAGKVENLWPNVDANSGVLTTWLIQQITQSTFLTFTFPTLTLN